MVFMFYGISDFGWHSNNDQLFHIKVGRFCKLREKKKKKIYEKRHNSQTKDETNFSFLKMKDQFFSEIFSQFQ